MGGSATRTPRSHVSRRDTAASSTETLFVPSVPPADRLPGPCGKGRGSADDSAVQDDSAVPTGRPASRIGAGVRGAWCIRRGQPAGDPIGERHSHAPTVQLGRWPASTFDSVGLPWEGMRALSDAIYVSALIDIEAGRGDEAAGSIVSGLGISASLRQEPDMLAQLIRTGLARSRQLDAIRMIITQTEPSSAALEELARWLMENRTPNGMSLGLLSDVKLGICHVRREWRMARSTAAP